MDRSRRTLYILILILLMVLSLALFSSCSASRGEASGSDAGTASAEASEEKGGPSPGGNEEVSQGEEASAPRRMIELYDYSDRRKYFNIYSGDRKIAGMICLPEGDGPFPVAFMAQGFAASCLYYEDIAVQLADSGIAAVLFEFTNVLSEEEDFSVLTEAEDLKDVVDGVRTMSFIDEDRMFLWGHSFGGLVATYVGCGYPEGILGMVLLEPAYQLRDQERELYPEGSEIPEIVYDEGAPYRRAFFEDLFSFDIYDMMPSFSGKALIIAGTKEGSIGADIPEYLERAEEAFPSAELLYIDGADHYFASSDRQLMTIRTIRFILGILGK